MLILRGDGAPSMYVFRLTFFRSPRPVYALVYSLDCRTHVFTDFVCVRTARDQDMLSYISVLYPVHHAS